jgi:UDP-N-acetylmuramate--alanine ligase
VKIAAAWSAARERGPRVHAVWRPHGFGPLALLYDDLINAVGQVLQAGDRFYLLPVFYAGGPAGGKQDSTQLGDAMRARGWAVTNVANYHSLTATVLANLREGDVVLVMGARDPGLPRFCRALLMDLDAARGNE